MAAQVIKTSSKILNTGSGYSVASIQKFLIRRVTFSTKIRKFAITFVSFRVGRFPDQTPLGTRLGLGTQPRDEAPGDLRVEIVKTH